MQAPPPLLSQELVDRLRRIALAQVETLDQLEAALAAGDTDQVIELAHRLVELEHQTVRD
jgi:HPt (histidine-containing phosphotransfer) domain-containing protein